MSLPLVSIIIPTYNRSNFIAFALDAIIQQTYTNWECIVVDDGSIDKTAVIVDDYCKKDKRFQYYKRPKGYIKGVNSCRNFGYLNSKGNYIAFCDDDDYWLPNKLELQMHVFANNKDIGLVTGNIEFVNEDGIRTNRVIKQTHNHGYVFKEFLFKNRVSMITPIIKKEVFNKVGFFNTNFKIQEDWEFWIRVSFYYKFYALPDVLACVRKHESNTSLIVTTAPLEQFLRHRKLMKSILEWGKGRFTNEDLKLIKNVEGKRYRKILRNHCKGYKEKINFIFSIFKINPKEAIRTIVLLIKNDE